jgi:membrane-bound serine protease (ClpP class)
MGLILSGFFLLAPAGIVAEEAAPDTESASPEVASRPADESADSRITDEGWFAPPKRQVEKPALPEPVENVFVIPIREEISVKTFEAMKRKAIRCRTGGAELIVIDMDTWGGAVHPALDIARLLKTELEDVYTVCYVRTRGVSAGAMIALACDDIIMTPTGKLGDCAPLLMGGELKGVSREKIESVLRTEFEESAERNGYSTALAKSMVSHDLEVWLVRNKNTRELRYVLEDQWRGRVEVPPGVSSAPSRSDAEWELLRVLLRKGRLLTMTPRQAKEYGFASQLIKPVRENELEGVLKHFNVEAEPTVLRDNWSERLVGFMTSPPVMGFLFFVAILCAYVEMHTPGFGVAGTVAVICFAILFGSRFLVGMAAWWEIALFALGLVLIALEIFVIPGFGVAGITGILCCVVGLLAMLVNNPPDKLPIPETDLDWSLFTNGIVALMIGFLLASATAVVLARFLPKTPVASRLILKVPLPTVTSPATADAPILSVEPGATGTVESDCRPVGSVRIEQDLVNAIADGGYIPAGTKVKVIKVEGNRVIVTPLA